MPDLTKVTSKINTGLKTTKTMEKTLEKEDDLLKKQYEMIQKDKENKLKEYRELLLKMKKNKRNDDIKKEVLLIFLFINLG